jgi:hypothetical protein
MNQPKFEGIHLEIDKETFKRLFPNLAREMESSENKVAVNSVRTDVKTGERAVSSNFVHYDPDVIDFLRRCDTAEQAEEIIAYMERRGEISKEYASKLRKQLKEKGVRSFGPKKEENYYLKRAGLLK